MEFRLQFQKLCQIETRKLFLVMGIIISLVFTIQFLLPPNEHEFLSIFPTNSTSIIEKNTHIVKTSSPKSKTIGTFRSSYRYGMKNKTKSRTGGNESSRTDNMYSKISISPTISPVGSSVFEDANFSPSVVYVESHPTSMEKEAKTYTLPKKGRSRVSRSSRATSKKKSIRYSDRVTKARMKKPPKIVTSISEMSRLLLNTRASSHSMKPHWTSERDEEILDAKLHIENAPIVGNDHELYGPVFRNLSEFKRSYETMEKILKVYVYKEGEKPVFHSPILEGIYASEGWFMKQMKENEHFLVKDPRKAHLFYLPFSSQVLKNSMYIPNSHSKKNLVNYLKDYLDLIMDGYPFWNRTNGADHFLTGCHDWAPAITKRDMSQCIRALCNSDVHDGFRLGKDSSLPETFVRSKDNPLEDLGGKPSSERRTLAFFAGNMHGYLRPIILNYWENKDSDMKIYGKMNSTLEKEMNYIEHMKSSKYCICAKGYEVNSPRVVEAIFYECVPVIISDNFVPPFFEVLDWEAFAVFVPEKDIPNLKNILVSIPEEKYIEMHKRVKKVQQHFLWHSKPVKYDIFHMILHSIWYYRVFYIETK